MIRFILAFMCVGLALSSVAQDSTPAPEKINWLTWDQAITQWQNDMQAYQAEPDPKKKVPPKKFFIDVYTDWCGWCKRMDKTTFADPIIIKLMNEHFYPVKLDAEMEEPIVWDGHTFTNPGAGQKGKRSTHQFAVSLLDSQMSYPSYALLDENARRIAIYKGFKQANDFLGIMLFFGKNQHIAYRDYITKYAGEK